MGSWYSSLNFSPSSAAADTIPVFDPAKHLAYAPPKNKLTMEELGLKGKGVSEIGVTEPFPLLSAEGVRALRGDIFSKPILDNFCAWTTLDVPQSPLCSCHGTIPFRFSTDSVVSSKLSSCQVRGMGTDGRAKFIADLWSHPDTIRACSEAAGMDLVPIMPYEVRKSISASHDLVNKCGGITHILPARVARPHERADTIPWCCQRHARYIGP